MNRIDEQAACWVVRVTSGPLAAQAQQALQQWLEADPRHRGAYVRAQAQWLDLDRLAALRGSSPVATALSDARAQAAASISRRHWLGGAAAALAGLGGGLSWVLLHGRLHYASDIGEMRRIALSDGSTVLLNTASEMLVRFDARQRRVALLRGEALFDVAHESRRPFVVVTQDMAVRAVGTAFDVRLGARQMFVTVTEGTVELGRSSAGSMPVVGRRVTVDERAVITGPSHIEVRPIAAAAAERLLAWREGLVSFNEETLRAAVEEINRYNRRQVVIDDPALAARPIVGVFRTTELEDFALAAAQALQAVVVIDGDRLRLRQRPG